MKCHYCGTEGLSKFCEKCGKRIIPIEPVLKPIPTVLICHGKNEDGTTCLSEVSTNKEFCGNCGTSVAKDPLSVEHCSNRRIDETTAEQTCSQRENGNISAIPKIKDNIEGNEDLHDKPNVPTDPEKELESKGVCTPQDGNFELGQGLKATMQDNAKMKDNLHNNAYSEREQIEKNDFKNDKNSLSMEEIPELNEMINDNALLNAEVTSSFQYKGNQQADNINKPREDNPQLGTEIKNTIHHTFQETDNERDTRNKNSSKVTKTYSKQDKEITSESGLSSNKTTQIHTKPMQKDGGTYSKQDKEITSESGLSSNKTTQIHTKPMQKDDGTLPKTTIDCQWETQPISEPSRVGSSQHSRNSSPQREPQKLGGSLKTDFNLKKKPTATIACVTSKSSRKCNIEIVFHALVPCKLFKSASSKVILNFKHDAMESCQHVAYTNKHDESLVELIYTLDVDRQILVEHLEYEYCILTVETYTTVIGNRTLVVSSPNMKNKHIWHQYDGIVVPDQNILVRGFKAFVHANQPLREKIISYARWYCPVWLEHITPDKLTTEQFDERLDNLEVLVQCLQRIYVTKVFSTNDDFVQEIGIALIDPSIDSLLDSCVDKSVFAISIVIACNKIGFRPPLAYWQKLCRCFIMDASNEEDIFLNLKNITKLYQNTDFRGALLWFMSLYKNAQKDPSWLFCVPILHFISNACRPFDKVQVALGHCEHEPHWWGIVEFKDLVASFKSKTADWEIPITEVLTNLEKLFKVDLYLPRSVVATLMYTELGTTFEMKIFPPEVCCAAVVYWLRHAKVTSRKAEQAKIIKQVGDGGLFLLNRLPKPGKHTEICSESWEMTSIFSAEVVEILFDKRTGDEIVTWGHICLISNVSCALMNETSKHKLEAAHGRFRSASSNIINWLNNQLLSGDMASFLKLWNKAFIELDQDNQTIDCWNEEVSTNIQSKIIDKMQGIDAATFQNAFIRIYCKEVGGYKKRLQDCLLPLANQVVIDGTKVNLNTMGATELYHIRRLLSGLFRKAWKDSVTSGNFMLESLLKWNPLRLLVANTAPEKKSLLLEEDLHNKIDYLIKMLHDTWDGIKRGNIEIGVLKMISNNVDEFSYLIRMIEPKIRVLENYIPTTIENRMCALKLFEKQAQQMTIFVNLCQHIKVDTSAIDDILLLQTDGLDLKKLDDICITSSPEPTEQHVTAFDSWKEIVDILPTLEYLNTSYVFKKLWCSTCSRVGTNCLTVNDVVKEVWADVETRWLSFGEQLNEGTLTFHEFVEMFGSISDESDQRLIDEMTLLYTTEHVALTRVKQWREYTRLTACVYGAEAILALQTQYKLEGDFEAMQTIAYHSGRGFKMNEFDHSFVATCDILKEITVKKASCINAFVHSKKLIKWLKKSISKQHELKVFVDLAIMSAGEEPINIAKVQCLYSAVMGYSPLIFDLKTKCDVKQLLEKCRLVWKELDTNKKLPDQLLDTNRQLSWLKEIKRTHGSVETSSLMDAEAINTDGTYIVGSSSKNKEDRTKPQDVQLTVPGIEGERESKKYNLSELQDLQSRLMLVAGKGLQDKMKTEVDVETFTLVFDSVLRLGNVYNQLCSAGCVLFSEWTARFMCNNDKNRPVCVVLSFGKGKDGKLKGRKSETSSLRDMIPAIAKFMEKCLDDWLLYIKTKRSQFYHLNYFTVDQLVLLQREMVMIGNESTSVYPLLSTVKHDCSPVDLTTAIAKAKDEQLSVEKIRKECKEMADNKVDQKGTETDQLKAIVICELMEMGHSEQIARMALDHVDENNTETSVFDQALIWCMMETDSVVNITKDTSDSKVEPFMNIIMDTIPVWADSNDTLNSIINSTLKSIKRNRVAGVAPLIESLQNIWTLFLGSISSKLRDYISLEFLGMVLNHLSEPETMKRDLPSYFLEGQPNLLICPTDDILKVTLSIYVHDEVKPLPSSDEILICNTKTSQDEVDIFWRRAIFGSGGKIYCLVHADLLNYDVGVASQKSLEQNILEANGIEDKRYRLIIICGSENECRSPFVAALDKYIRHIELASLKVIKEYVSSKMVVPATRTNSASSIDFERSSTRVVKSSRPGVGKTLYIKKRFEELEHMFNQSKQRLSTKLVYIPLQEKQIDMDEFINDLLWNTATHGTDMATLYHIDISREVTEGIDYLLFNLLVLGCLTDSKGLVWRRRIDDLYMIETIPSVSYTQNREPDYVHTMLAVLPDVFCKSPIESLSLLNGNSTETDVHDQLFGEDQFQSEAFQRTFQYLNRQESNKPIDDVDPSVPEGSQPLCLNVLLRHCGVKNPSWSELNHFVWFFNLQLVDFKQSPFVGTESKKDLPGFAKFVLRFLIQMSKDFSTRSLNMGEESHIPRPAEDDTYDDNVYIQQFQLKRTWESSPHPYLFFNADHNSFTFLGFFIDENTGNLIDMQTKEVLDTGIMDRHLYRALADNGVPLKENFDKLTRDEQIDKMCKVMGVENPCDPDPTYELTTDNAKKIMAIYMRFRCDIPVIIMGETGSGKTRLVKFMCALQTPKGSSVKTMIIMKVHGGTTKHDIKRTVKAAEEVSKTNGPNIFTVLFFDEANTTEAVGVIKEIMCDKSICGKPLKLFKNLKIIAACNPYRKHPKELIKKLEQAGLGYHVDADDTCDRLGRIPMRRLVYRVQPLPHSLRPMVWDFGQLDERVEQLYIKQMIKQLIRVGQLPMMEHLETVLSSILTASQKYMRDQKDECSFVSLRDVERALKVMVWFYNKSNKNRLLFSLMDKKMQGGIDDLTKSLILALGVCYHASLRTRKEYRQFIAPLFDEPFKIQGESHAILAVIECCQDVVLDNLSLRKNIARNTALKENIFMMIICIELRIPLFLVGKPGSSKSLAKTIVADAMQGHSANSDLFKELKQVQMMSYQCSPLSTPDGIIATFRQCAEFQKDKNLNSFVSVVVLDEVGLAEDSPRMPLKTLHPLLEDGGQSDEMQEPFKQVAFVGISNWALDPAKMNRGISVQRDVPGVDELIKSARGICKSNSDVGNLMEPFVGPISRAYMKVFETASKTMREFYGLRDFYSLVKMLSGFVAKTKKAPTWTEMLHAIKRNFGGLDLVQPEKYFKKELSNSVNFSAELCDRGPDCSTKGLIEACLFDSSRKSRYLMLLTENYGALGIVLQMLAKRSEARPVTIFGSSFPSDQEYTQVCRNINKIKVCMETGNTVILLNLENLYESLYDALNQYYVRFGGERYVDLGLGTHRVKCLVHRKFRLIVVADKEVVYKKFPIPLINRLEKHFLTVNTVLNKDQIDLAKDLRQWAYKFANKQNSITRTSNGRETNIGDVLIGVNDDTCSSIILNIIETTNGSEDDFCKWKTNVNEILEKGKRILLWSATPEALVRTNELSSNESNSIMKHYFEIQAHGSVIEYLKHMIVIEGCQQLLTQITCHSKLFPCNYDTEIRNAIPSLGDVDILSLVSFDTEQQFSNRIKQHFDPSETKSRVIIIQCDSGDANTNLIACARYSVMDALENTLKNRQAPIHILFIVQLPRISGGCFSGFQCGLWRSIHIDDLYPEGPYFPHLKDLHNRSVSEVFERACDGSQINHEGEINNLNAMKMKGLLMQCVHQALSMVKDQHHSEHRATTRIRIVLRCLRGAKTKTDESEEKQLFLSGIMVWLTKLLREKEKNTDPSWSKQWMSHEAAALENIIKNGTFRRSCYQTLMSKLTPVLAGIFSFLDTNNNLDLLECDLHWKQDFWLKFFNQQAFIPFKYSGIQQPDGSIFKEYTVECTGYEGHRFKSTLPFSWVIIDLVDQLMRQLEFDEQQEPIEKCSRLLLNGQCGHVLTELRDTAANLNCLRDILQSYVHDFAHTIYKPEWECEIDIVYERIMSKAMQICESSGTNKDLIEHIICVHIAYERSSHFVSLFRSINSVWQQCSENIKTEDFSLDDNVFILTSLHGLVKDLTPTSAGLMEGSAQRQWLKKVSFYRPVVETILTLSLSDEFQYNCKPLSTQAKSMWDKVVVMKLFLENVCSDETENKVNITFSMTLWKLLGNEVNMKEMKTFKTVETFLKQCNKKACNDCQDSQVKCDLCEADFTSVPLSLPCSKMHAVCEACFRDMKAHNDTCCPKCEEDLGKEWDAVKDIKKKIGNEKLENYQKRCNIFFIEILTQLCFVDNLPPSRDVVEKLLEYVTYTSKSGQKFTKSLNLFDTGLDPTPIFRSLLLQLLLRTSDESYILGYLKRHFEDIKDAGSTSRKDVVDMHILIINCWEDIMLQQFQKDDQLTCDKVYEATEKIQMILSAQTSSEIEFTNQLYCVASTRACLAIAARCLFNIAKSKSDVKTISNEDNGIIQAARTLCENKESKWPKIYLVKHLCRRYGVEAYTYLSNCKEDSINWVAFGDNLKTNQAVVADNYVVCGQSYIRLREALTRVVIGDNVQNMQTIMQDILDSKEHCDVYLCLAIHREIANPLLWSLEPVSSESLKTLTEFIQQNSLINESNKDLIMDLTKNNLQPDFLVLAPGIDILHQSVQCLMTHFKIVMSNIDQGSQIAGPFIDIMSGDTIITSMFLPAMPEDNLEEIRDALIFETDQTVVLYACPNGHRYTIGDCGRPWEKSICPECKAEIGGEYHNAANGNVRFTCQDLTEKGHILQKAVKGGSPRPERDLMPMHCSAIKLILHMAMFLGPVDQIKDIIHPNVVELEISAFLMDHIHANLEELQTILKCSVDDVVLLMHCVIHEMMLHKEIRNDTLSRLQTKGDRKQWENAFSANILNGAFSNRDQSLKTLSHAISSDERLGADPLKRLIYEVDNTENATEIPNNIREMRSAWCFRSPITLEHIRVQLDTAATNNRHKTLKHFLKEDYILKALRRLPSILRLQRFLLQRFQKRLDKAGAKNLTVKHMKDEMHAGQHTIELIDEFANAWDITRKNLEHYACRTNFGFVRVPNELLCAPIHDGTPLAVFLPATDGPGLCSYVMTHFLCHKQNEMMNVYRDSERHSEIQKIAPMDITAAHMISYDEENDLMPLVLANCHYAFEVGVGTQIEYDLVGLERQVMDRFLFSKSLIDLQKIPMVDVMIYRTELTNKAVLETIAQIIPQAKLNSAIKTQIYDELRFLPDVCTSLQNLDIAISFLQITGGDSDKSLKTFMEESLQMGSTLLSQTACKSCELQHTQALWLLLSFQKSKIQIDSGQTNEETFETLPKELLCDIPEDIGNKFLTYIRDLSSEKLLNMLEKLHEFLVLHLAVRENVDDDDYVNNTEYSLFDGLDSLIEDEFLLASFPKEVLFKHSVHAWVMAYEELKVKTTRK